MTIKFKNPYTGILVQLSLFIIYIICPLYNYHLKSYRNSYYLNFLGFYIYIKTKIIN